MSVDTKNGARLLISPTSRAASGSHIHPRVYILYLTVEAGRKRIYHSVLYQNLENSSSFATKHAYLIHEQILDVTPRD